nr:MAG TPA: tail assembly chaperone protein [Caudoviricetes sp.]
MSRIVNVTIAGKNYPMSFSLGASKKMIERYGGAEQMKASLEKAKDVQKIDMVVEMLELLIAQGCAYKNYFEKDIPAPDHAPIIEGKWTPLPREALEIAVGVYDVEELSEKIMECIGAGSKKEVEVRSEGKNVNGGQE